MGKLVDGHWQTSDVATCDKTGRFIRADSQFRHWIRADGSTEFNAEPNRYHLYLSYACPWACRTLIFRQLKQLHEVITVSFVEPLMGDNGWEFSNKDSLTQDPFNHKQFLYEIYLLANPHYSGKVTVPVLWDKHKKTIVNNESAEIIRMLNSEFNAFTDSPLDFYPPSLQKNIDSINDFVYKHINNGVYRCGFAKSQQAYEEAFDALFSALNTLEEKLNQQPYLAGDQLTEADWRLFTTLIRFDSVYVGHFKCNLKRIEDYPNLSNYLRALYQMPGIKATVRFDHIKQHYYRSHLGINPTGIVPKGPEVDYNRAHDRQRLQ